MYKLLMILLVSAFFSCSGNKTETTDTLMDSTTIKMNADTVKDRLDHLEDSVERLRAKAAQEN